jgi:hypothetical protein
VIRSFVVSVVALAGVAGGCDDAPPDAPLPDEQVIRSGLSAYFAGDHPTADDTANGDCFAAALLARANPQQLQVAGILDNTFHMVTELPLLSEQTAGLWVDAQFECTDFVEESARAQVEISNGAVDPAAYAACLRERVPDAQLRAAVVDTLTGNWDGPGVTALTEAQQTCAGRAF